MSLNEQQLAVVNSTANRILCLAGAGAGKTHTMIERLKHLVSNGVSPNNILVLTFTNAAATEMRSRYQKFASDGGMPEFRTFHSFCYSLICSDGVVRNKLGYRDIPTIIDDVTEKRVRTTILSELSLKIPVAVLEKTKKPSPKEKASLDLYDKQFRKYLIRTSQITFDILCYDICKLFKDSDQTIFPYKVKYKYIFVDEFQDTDPKQWEFVNSFKSSDLFVVGDVSQSLYSFRGADSTIIKSLAKFPEWTTYKMNRNYRSTKQICDFANKISHRYADESTYLEMWSDRSGDKVKCISYEDEEEIFASIRKNLTRNKGTAAILARTNREVYNICQHLEKYDIKYATNSTDKHIGYILSSVADNGFYIDFLSSLLDTEHYLTYIKRSQLEKPEDPVKFILTNFSTPYMKLVNDKVENIRLYLTNGLKREDSPVKLCINVIKRFRSDYDGIPNCSCTLTSIINAAIEELNILTKDGNGIYVGTVHSVKGLEYDTVFVTGVGGKSFPIRDQEQNNIYYVACTRAKNKLFIYVDESCDLINSIEEIINKTGDYEYENQID